MLIAKLFLLPNPTSFPKKSIKLSSRPVQSSPVAVSPVKSCITLYRGTVSNAALTLKNITQTLVVLPLHISNPLHIHNFSKQISPSLVEFEWVLLNLVMFVQNMVIAAYANAFPWPLKWLTVKKLVDNGNREPAIFTSNMAIHNGFDV